MLTQDRVREALKDVIDPEMGFPILDLGLVYDVRISHAGIEVDFTVTYPGCPVAPEIQQSIARHVEAIARNVPVRVNLVWQPRWTPEMMCEEAKLEYGVPL